MTRSDDDKAVEAVAEALWLNAAGEPKGSRYPWAGLPDVMRDTYRGEARAAIAAYRAHLEANKLRIVHHDPALKSTRRLPPVWAQLGGDPKDFPHD